MIRRDPQVPFLIQSFTRHGVIDDRQQVLIELSRGKHPPRPPPSPMITDDYWDFMRMCWAITPTDRPLIEEVLESIEDEYDVQVAKARPLRDLTGQVKRILGEGYIPFEFVHVWEGLWSGRNVRGFL
jgi:hypothetical protein